ncbi:MAG: hypothetical protein SVW57_11620 [Thermodesulfobacteriota bacterium]|nr:hypothetical protein [Thermodesulfobacteriota bacterium]
MNRLKVTICVLLIFVLGALAGSLGTGLYVKHKIKKFTRDGPPPIMRFLMREMSHELKLSKLQESEIEKIVEQTHKRISDFRERYRPEFEEIIDNSFALIKEKLTQEQRIKLDELRKELQKRRGRVDPPGIFQLHQFHKAPEHIFATMKERLNLTKEQEEKIREIIDESIEKKQNVMGKHREKSRGRKGSMRNELQTIWETTEQKLEQVLTQDQCEEYRKIQKESHQ